MSICLFLLLLVLLFVFLSPLFLLSTRLLVQSLQSQLSQSDTFRTTAVTEATKAEHALNHATAEMNELTQQLEESHGYASMVEKLTLKNLVLEEKVRREEGRKERNEEDTDECVNESIHPVSLGKGTTSLLLSSSHFLSRSFHVSFSYHLAFPFLWPFLPCFSSFPRVWVPEDHHIFERTNISNWWSWSNSPSLFVSFFPPIFLSFPRFLPFFLLCLLLSFFSLL